MSPSERSNLVVRFGKTVHHRLCSSMEFWWFDTRDHLKVLKTYSHSKNDYPRTTELLLDEYDVKCGELNELKQKILQLIDWNNYVEHKGVLYGLLAKLDLSKSSLNLLLKAYEEAGIKGVTMLVNTL